MLHSFRPIHTKVDDREVDREPLPPAHHLVLSPMLSWCMMSLRTRDVAVAVSAIIGTPGKR